MIIAKLDILDGQGTIDVSVQDYVAYLRLTKYFADSKGLFEDANEDQSLEYFDKYVAGDRK